MWDYKICASGDCTLCMACVNVCPRDAIRLDVDAYGYEMISVDSEKCVACGRCIQVCSRRREISVCKPGRNFAAQAKDTAALLKSASGGAFQMLARIVLEKGGVCYGSALEKENGMFAAKHVRIDSLGELPKILNSKYIPSVTGMAFLKAKEDLVQGRLVLFSGTPCQIQGLMAFLGRDYGNLLTADLVCHGITSTNLFNDYLACLEKTEGIGITDFSFRDKSVSWGTNYCFAYYKKTDGKKREKRRHCPREASSYMHHYLRGNIFRENCYSCSRSNTERVSDFTLGDYWEIESEHPEFVTKYSPRISLRRGVSCILVNSPKAEEFVELLEDKMILHAVTLESIVAHNSNLAEPSPRGMDRDRLLQMYRECGYEPIEEEYRRLVADRMKVYYLKNTLKSRLPDWIRVLIYRSSVLRKLVFRL